MTAVDTTVSLSTAQVAGLRAAGVVAVVRYLAPQSWKRLTPAEAGRYRTAGMPLAANWESDARDLLVLDVATTAAHAHEAVRQAQADGFPPGCWIYNSGADYDVQAGDWARIAANLRIIRPIYRAGGFGLGMYSSWDALTWAHRDGLVDGYWQSMSPGYSAGRNARTLPFAHLRQHLPTTIAGVSCDPNDVLIPAFGQAGAGISSTSAPGGDMELDTPIPGSGYGANPKGLDVRLALIDLTKAIDPYDTTSWQNETLRNTRQLVSAAAADEKRDAVLLATLQALTAGGTSVDTTAVLAAIRDATAAESTTVAALAAQVADLQRKLAAAAAAEATALGQ